MLILLDLLLAYLAIQGRDIKLGEKILSSLETLQINFIMLVIFNLNVDTFPDLKDIEIKHHLDFICKANLAMLLMRLESSLDSYKFNEAAKVHFIDLFGWSFVIGELSTQKLLKSLL